MEPALNQLTEADARLRRNNSEFNAQLNNCKLIGDSDSNNSHINNANPDRNTAHFKGAESYKVDEKD